MELLKYDKKKEKLSVRWNTTAVWNYTGITDKDYTEIVNSPSPGNHLSKLVHKTFIIGERSEVK